MSDRLEIRTLGGFSALLGGRPVKFEQQKSAALLVYLACTNRPQPREVLAEMLWENRSRVQALANLRVVLTELRHVAGPSVRPERGTVAMAPDADWWLDVAAFERQGREAGQQRARLEEALALYQGGFLEGFYITSRIFEEWMRFEQERLQPLALAALDKLLALDVSAGEYTSGIAHAAQSLRLDPLREPTHQQLMRLLALSGQRSAALAQYEECRRLLADELGVEPSAATVSLYEDVLAGRLVPPSASSRVPMFLAGSPARGQAERPLFVGREAERSQLDSLLEWAIAGRGQVAFVLGEAGSGKTLLVQDLIWRAQEQYPDLVVASGNCNAYTGIGDPYLPFVEILEMLSGDAEAKWAGGLITREHAGRLWLLLPIVLQALLDQGPELIGRLVPGPSLLARAEAGASAQAGALKELLDKKAGQSARTEQQIDLFQQYTKVLQVVAARVPVLLFVDDLQWADAGSISLLFHLGLRLKGQRILLLGAYRPEEIATERDGKRHPLERVINELRRDYGDSQVDLQRAEGRPWLDALLDSEPNQLGDDFRETLYAHTGGHPLFTVELLRYMQEQSGLEKDPSGRWVERERLDWDVLPPRVEAVIAERVGRLSSDMRATLEIASVEGDVFTAQVLAFVQGVQDREVVECLSGPLSRRYQLVSAAGIGRTDGRAVFRYRFRHFLFQKYLYSHLDDVERVHLHGLIGRALENLYADHLAELTPQLARHFEAAGRLDQAVKYLHQAGDRATYLSANAEAISHYRHALELIRQLPATEERAVEELRLLIALRVPVEVTYGYTSPEVAEVNAASRELARYAPVSADLFWLLVGWANFDILCLSLNEGELLCAELRALAQRLGQPALQLYAHYQSGIVTLYLGRMTEFLEHRRRAVDFFRLSEGNLAGVYGAAHDPEAGSRAHEAWATWLLGYPDRARECAQAAIARAEEVGQPYTLGLTHFFACTTYRWCRDVPTTHRLADQLTALGRDYKMAFWLSSGMSARGWALAQEGSVAEGVGYLEQQMAVKKAAGSQLAGTMAVVMLGEAYVVARDEKGLALLDEGLRVAQSTGFAMMEPEIHRTKGSLLVAIGAPDAQAEACFLRAIEKGREIGAKSCELRAALHLARLWQRQGRGADGYDLVFPIYDWFTEGFDTPDLQEAQKLLEELSPPIIARGA